MSSISTDGDVGDCIYTLGVISGIPNPPHTLLARVQQLTKSKTQEVVDQLVFLLKRLVEKQPYIKEFRSWKDGDTREWDSGGFRLANMHMATYTLLNAYYRHFKSKFPNSPCGDGSKAWLTCGKSPKAKDRIIINRTDRYRNKFFPWNEIVQFYGKRLLFVGTPDEHEKFCNDFGEVEYQKTKDMLDVAELINGSLLFIGNQSCANAIAEGLKHDLIQETSLDIPDCIFRRPNAKHVIDGAVELPNFDGGNPLKIKHRIVDINDIDTTTVPPNRWLVRLPDGYEERHIFLDHAFNLGSQNGMTREDVMRQNAEEYREYFFHTCYASSFSIANTALRNA